MPIDPRDKLDIESVKPKGSAPPPAKQATDPADEKRRFLSILFRCCSTYGRLYVNAEGSHYVGRCPKCGARTKARIGRGGTDQRIFEAG